MCGADADCSASTTFKGCDTTLGMCTKCTDDKECCGTKTAPCGITCNKTKGTCECKDTQSCTDVWGTAVPKPPWECK